jgi:hypothetical protein
MYLANWKRWGLSAGLCSLHNLQFASLEVKVIMNEPPNNRLCVPSSKGARLFDFCGTWGNASWIRSTSSCEVLSPPAPLQCRTLPVSCNCCNQRRIALSEGGYFPYRILWRSCMLITDFVSKNQSKHIPFSLTLAIFRHDIFSPIHQWGEYSVAKYSLSLAFIFRKQFCFGPSGLKIIGNGNPDNNLESPCIFRREKNAKQQNNGRIRHTALPPK